MNTLLFGIILSALLSATSLLAVLMRVSPLTAPLQAVTAFYVSFFLTVSTVGALIFVGIWKVLPVHTWDSGRLIGISMRQGIELGISMTALMFFHQIDLLNWWIGVMIFAAMGLVEAALEH